MKASEVVEQLVAIKKEFTNMTSDEVLQVMLIKTLIEIKGKIKTNGR